MAYNPELGLVYIGVGNGSNENTPMFRNKDVPVLEGFSAHLLAWDLRSKKKYVAPHSGRWNGGVLSTAGDPVKLTTSDALYHQYCAKLLGPGVYGGVVLPDLRYSPMISNQESWKAVVLDRALNNNGMIGFAGSLDAEAAESIRAYVIDRAQAL